MTDAILVINAGSSSIKFSVFTDISEPQMHIYLKGCFEDIGAAPKVTITKVDGEVIKEESWQNEPHIDHAFLTENLLDFIFSLEEINLIAVGHRVAHGGEMYSQATLVDADVVANLEELTHLAPLHVPHNLGPIKIIATALPELPQVACFDTMFHFNQLPEVKNYAIPHDLTDEGIHRYGFHGLSYEYITHKLEDIEPKVAAGRVIVAHLGNGASMCAIKNSQSIACTMEFSAISGLTMGTRCGALDPGVIFHLVKEKGMDIQEVENLLYKQSGLLGISGISNNMRVLLDSDVPQAKEAITHFVYRINRELGSLTAALGGLDALIFTGGIGERAVAVREQICKQSEWLGIKIDPKANNANEYTISSGTSKIPVFVIPTDEELMIARHAKNILK